MDTDFKSLEQRYGTSMAMKICEEIAKAEHRHFNYYRASVALKSMKRFVEDEAKQERVPYPKTA